MCTVDYDDIARYKSYLKEKEKSVATIEKYIRDVTALSVWLGGQAADKERLLEYKEEIGKRLSPQSVNSVISSINSLLDYLGAPLRLKTLKIQRRIFADKSRELTKAEYERLLRAAKQNGNERLHMLLQTICTTGIRVSELKHITVEAVKQGKAEINCKGKLRIILLPKELCRRLKKYTAKREIKKAPYSSQKQETR